MSSIRSTVSIGSESGTENVEKTMQVARLIRAYQGRGHELSDLDPLNIMVRPTPEVLELQFYGLAESESEMFHVGTAGESLFPEAPDAPHSLGEIVSRLKTTYCQTIGYEYMYIQEQDRCDWLRTRVEGKQEKYSAEKKKALAQGLAAGHGFEAVLEKKFGTEKRFGLDGCESLIPGMNQMIATASANGVDSMVIGMPHRGRLNLLCNVMQKPIEMIFNEFAGLNSDMDGSVCCSPWCVVSMDA
jgi:2-oxoglutarate dehydrogenase E1 component